jgi:hypothetical protein
MCLGFDQPQQVLAKIKVEDLFEVFNSVGSVRKIMIFSKSPIIKAFIEFGSINEADLVKDIMHDSFINNFGKVRLFFSTRDRIVNSGNAMDYWETKLTDTKKASQIVDNLKTQMKNSIESVSFLDKRNPAKDSENQSKTCNIQKVQCIDNQTDPTKLNPPYDPTQWFLGENRVILKRLNINPISVENSGTRVTNQLSEEDSFSNFGTWTPSRVIFISNIDNFFESSNEIFNFFSCFGNIVRILLIKNLNKALIEFVSIENSQICIQQLCTDKKGMLTSEISFSKILTIDAKTMPISESVSKCIDFRNLRSEEQRYNSMNTKIRSLSTDITMKIHFTSEVNADDKLIIVSGYLESIGAHIMGNRIEYFDGFNLQIGYRLESIYDAIRVIAKLHGFQNEESSTEISFAY